MPTCDMCAAGPFRNGVERAIASLARARAVRDAGVHVFADDASEKESMEGAEWWIQDVAPDEPPKTFHTDCDLVMRGGASRGDDAGGADATEVAHPAVASVLYVSNCGGPTAVFGQRMTRAKERNASLESRSTTRKTSRADDDAVAALTPRYPSEVAVAHPLRNTLLLFEGDRYHAVMHPPSRSPERAEEVPEGGAPPPRRAEVGQRVTVLVNWWRERPRGPADLPARFVTPPFAETRHEHTRPSDGRPGAPPSSLALPVVRMPHAFREHAAAWRAQTVPSALDAASRAHHAFAVRYAPTPPPPIEPGSDETSVQEWPFEDDDARDA